MRFSACLLVILPAHAAARCVRRDIAHPGLLHNEQDFARIREHVESGREPWKTGLQKLVAKADPVWQPRAAETVCRGNNAGCDQNYPVLYRDVHAAYANALYWKLTGNTTHADAAVRIVDAWSGTMKFLNGSTDAALVAGIQGYQLANVAEILRTYEPWTGLDAVTKLLVDVFYEASERFLRTKNGQPPDHYWANVGYPSPPCRGRGRDHPSPRCESESDMVGSGTWPPSATSTPSASCPTTAP